MQPQNSKVLAFVFGGKNDGKCLYSVDDDSGKQKIVLDKDEMFIFEPSEKDRFILSTGAASGSGKSTQLLNIALRYHFLFPKRPIVLVSRLNEDETLDKAKFIKRINIDSLLEKQFELNEFPIGGLVIVDDVEGLDKQREAAVQNMVDIILTQGRHQNVSLLHSSHLLTNGHKTRLLLNESHAYLIFPQATSFMQINYLLSKYAGLDTKQIKEIRDIPSRWVLVTRRYPTCIISDKMAYLPHSYVSTKENNNKKLF